MIAACHGDTVTAIWWRRAIGVGNINTDHDSALANGGYPLDLTEQCIKGGSEVDGEPPYMLEGTLLIKYAQ